MKAIFILALIATLVAFTTAYYPGGQLPSDGRLGASRGLAREDARDLTWEDEEEEQRLKVKGLLKEIGRKVIVPKIIDKLQTLEEDDTEFQKVKLGKIVRTFVVPKIISALEESTEDEGAIAEDLVGGHFTREERKRAREDYKRSREDYKRSPCFPKWRCRTPMV